MAVLADEIHFSRCKLIGHIIHLYARIELTLIPEGRNTNP